jgi:hypothetical protein
MPLLLYGFGGVKSRLYAEAYKSMVFVAVVEICSSESGVDEISRFPATAKRARFCWSSSIPDLNRMHFGKKIDKETKPRDAE